MAQYIYFKAKHVLLRYCCRSKHETHTHLGVHRNLGGLGGVSSLVDVHVADALAVAHHRNLRASLSNEMGQVTKAREGGAKGRKKRGKRQGGIF